MSRKVCPFKKKPCSDFDDDCMEDTDCGFKEGYMMGKQYDGDINDKYVRKKKKKSKTSK